MKKLLTLAIIFFLLFSLKNTFFSVKNSMNNNKIITNLNKELEDAKKEHQFLSQQLFYVKSDEYVEKQAREKLGLSKNGEQVVIAPPPPENVEITSIVPINKEPNWKKWLKLFF